MDLFFNEASLDKSIENSVISKNGVYKTTDSYDEIHGLSYYGDLSNISKITDDKKFIKRLKEECDKTSSYSKRIVYIPVNSWSAENKMNSVNMLLRFIKTSPKDFKEQFTDITFIFINSSTKQNFALVVNMYEPNQYNTVIGLLNRISTQPKVKALTGTEHKTVQKEVIDKKKVKEEKKKENKEKLVKAIEDKVENNSSETAEEAMEDIDNDEEIMAILAQVEEDENPSISKTRAARMTKVNKQFLDSTVGTKSVRSTIYDSKENIEPSHLKVSSINKDEWDKVKFTNFENAYDINKDILSMLYSLSEKTYPISIIKVDVEDTSTSMDYIYTYTVKCEDSFGKRFSFKFDIPKFINNRFMMLRGNEKTMSGQLMLLPCLKTDKDTVQIVSNYNKIFVRKYGMMGKSYPASDRLVKSLNKYKGHKLKIVEGDNTLICNKYELPVDYIDLASNFNSIETVDKIYFFDQDLYYKKYNADPKIGIPYSIDKKTDKVNYYTEDNEDIFSLVIAKELCDFDDDLAELFRTTKASNRQNYSKASILNSEIPMIVLLGYHMGLEAVLKKCGIVYEIDKSIRAKKDEQAMVKFKDENLVYNVTYESNMLLNGLSECDTENYSFSEMDKKHTWLDFLDTFGGRSLSDGLDNFYDLFMDPITKEVCEHCKLPYNYLDILIYSNNLLADNKFNRHTDISGNRYRTNEIVAAYFYIALAKAYEQYTINIKRGSNSALTMKQTAVIDAILTSNISSDLSTLNPLLEITTASTATFKGPSGMNTQRAYSLDKRTYDDSMINKLALSTGFAENVGIDRQTTIDMDIEGTRGYIKDTNPDDISVTKTLSMSEALTPFGTTRDK